MFIRYLRVVKLQGRNPMFVFWEKLWLDNLVSRLTDLYQSTSELMTFDFRTIQIYTVCSLTVLQWCQNEIEYSMRNKRKLKLLKVEKEEKRSKWDSPKISSWMQIADIWRTSYHLRPWPFWWSSVLVESLTKIERMFLETLVSSFLASLLNDAFSLFFCLVKFIFKSPFYH